MKVIILISIILSSSTVFSMEWREAVNQLIEMQEAAKADPLTYPELAERTRALFPENDPVRITISSAENGVHKKEYRTYPKT